MSVPAEGAAAQQQAPNLNDFLYDIGQLEREKEIDRILREFKLNPLAILDLPSEPTESKILAVYKKLSLLVHPDKVKPEIRDRAEQAFTLLSQAKADLQEEEKKAQLNLLVTSARASVIKKKEVALKELRKKEHAQRDTNVLAALDEDKLRAEQAADKIRDFTKDSDFEDLVRLEVRELIIEREWKKRQLMKAAVKEETDQAAQKKEKALEAEEKKEQEKDWEDGRDRRVGDWRTFMNQGKKKKRKEYKPPKRFEEDEENTYVRRPAKNPRNELAPGIGDDV